MNRYKPEIGQALFGNPTEKYALPDYAEALLMALLDEIGRVYSNVYQVSWDQTEEPNIPGITFHPYWWGEDDDPGALLPNFAFDGVEIRWYKYPGRGMSCNRNMISIEWTKWFSKCLAVIRAADENV